MAALVAVAVADSASLLDSIHQQDTNGNYQFSFHVSDGTGRQESQNYVPTGEEAGFNKVSGNYEFVDPEGQKHTYQYTADENGYVANEV